MSSVNNNRSALANRSKNPPTTEINHSSHSRYGTSLIIGVIFIFATRLPTQLSPFILLQKSTFNQILYVLLNLPLLLSSALNPWMYAYHNLDLKPVMRRLVKKFCKKIVSEKVGQKRAPEQSFMTHGQISMFASVPRRSTFLHSSAAVLSATPVATGPIQILQQPVRPVLKSQRSVSQMCSYKFKNSILKKAPRRTKSCVNQKIPIVTVWDGNSIKEEVNKTEEML